MESDTSLVTPKQNSSTVRKLANQKTLNLRKSLGSISDDTKSLRNSTGKFQLNKSQEIIPHYLRASTGSCHDLCKYGHGDRKNTSEEKPWRVAKKVSNSKPKLKPPSDLKKTPLLSEKRGNSCVEEIKSSSEIEILSNDPPEIIKREISLPEAKIIEVFPEIEMKMPKIPTKRLSLVEPKARKMKQSLGASEGQNGKGRKIVEPVKSLDASSMVESKDSSPSLDTSEGQNGKIVEPETEVVVKPLDASSMSKDSSPSLDTSEGQNGKIVEPETEVVIKPLDASSMVELKDSSPSLDTSEGQNGKERKMVGPETKIVVKSLDASSMVESKDSSSSLDISEGQNGKGRKITEPVTEVVVKPLDASSKDSSPSLDTSEGQNGKGRKKVGPETKLVAKSKGLSPSMYTTSEGQNGKGSKLVGPVSVKKNLDASSSSKPSITKSRKKLQDQSKLKKGISVKPKIEKVTEKTLHVVKIEPVNGLVKSPENPSEKEKEEESEIIRNTSLKKGKTVITKEAQKLSFRRGKVLELEAENNTPKRLRFRRGGVVVGHHQDGKSEVKRTLKKKVNSDEKIRNNPIKVDTKVVLRHQDVQNKKDPQVSLNYVIEETASKLVVSRKSKVKALVGAFETVISLQEKPS